MAGPAAAQRVLFDFNSAPLHAPLPITLTEGGVTATLSATGQGFSVQLVDVVGFTPLGFSGYWLYPNSLAPSDLRVTFSARWRTSRSCTRRTSWAAKRRRSCGSRGS